MLDPVLALALLAAPAFAAAPLPPIVGTYNSVDIPGGTVLSGLFSESWPSGGSLQLTNTVNSASWDGTQLGAQWRVWCPSIAQLPTMVGDTRDLSGTGDVTWLAYYGGGLFWLSKDGPWSGDNLLDFTGAINQFRAVTTYSYVAGALLGIRSNITTVGTFDRLHQSWSVECFEYSINNATVFGSTNQEPLPAGFPGFLDPANCPSDIPALSAGAWGSATQITLRVTGCAVPTQVSTWGAVKSRY